MISLDDRIMEDLGNYSRKINKKNRIKRIK